MMPSPELPPAHLRALRADAVARLRAVSESPGLDADLLLAEALGVDRAAILADLDRVPTTEAAAQFSAWLERAAAGEPIAYLLGRRGFYDLDLIVTPDVLIPRPETELLLEAALAWAAENPVAQAADIGTGSGALAVTFARHYKALVHAVDISPAALDIARLNAVQAGTADCLTFYQGDLLQPLIAAGVRVDLLMANLPYIAADLVPQLDVSRYEPVLALDGGGDGLMLIRRLLADLPRVLAARALVLLEIGADQGEAAQRLTAEALPGAQIRLMQDYAGLDRFIWAETG